MKLPVASAGLALGLLACVDQPRLGSSADGVTWEEFRAAVYQEPDTGMFIVDWDRPIRGEAALFELYSSLQQGALTIYNNGADVKWSATQKKNLTYCVSDTFGANKAAVLAAMAAATENGWENMADVDFKYVPAQDASCTATNTNVLFDIRPVNSGGQYLARAFFPDSPRGDRNVLVDVSAFDPQQTGGIPLANIMGHELGHTLGFRHEHVRPEANAAACAEDNQFRGVTPYDSASVMHYPQCNGTSTTLAFTQRDREGVALVYGAPVVNMPPMAQVTAPQNGATVAPTFTVSTSIVDTDIARVELHVDGAAYATSTTAPYTFQVTQLAPGPHALELRAIDGADQTVTTTLNVT
ncbi:MAG: matrixin family metalloprotease, partial [Deltaproteobacteria bacterium]|nr:matrixin family metalloprotease [Kofleriaceae bacterium]